MHVLLCPQPHESHFSHILSRHERDAVNDHRFEPMAVQRLRIRSRHEQRQRRYVESLFSQKSLCNIILFMVIL